MPKSNSNIVGMLLLLFSTHAYLLSPDEGLCYVFSTRNNCCEFLALYGDTFQSVIKSYNSIISLALILLNFIAFEFSFKFIIHSFLISLVADDLFGFTNSKLLSQFSQTKFLFFCYINSIFSFKISRLLSAFMSGKFV